MRLRSLMLSESFQNSHMLSDKRKKYVIRSLRKNETELLNVPVYRDALEAAKKFRLHLVASSIILK